LAEFTGERVIPGEVDPDLWNEHFARYAFAARLSLGKRVLDAGCGSGYGAAELALSAAHVTGIDPSPEATASAASRYPAPNIHFRAASLTALPFPNASFDLAVAFEVIEHVEDWACALAELRRVLTPRGQLILSTPNKLYYAESRRLHGPNPFHVHEFEFDEFAEVLRQHFPHVSLFLQNHAEGIVFEPVAPEAAAEVLVQEHAPNPQDAHFFLAVCSASPQTGAPTFVYLPRTANVLREREQHIAKLEAELATKNQWLQEREAEHVRIVEQLRLESERLEESQRWAQRLDAEIDRLRLDFTRAMEHSEAELKDKVEWARRLDAELAAKGADLERVVKLLDQAEATVIQRTEWAQQLSSRVADLETRLHASTWLKVGRALGFAPGLRRI
jgi:SAM-dependent methyltransferase